MIVLGLTGSLGMGKSTVARMFKRLHVPVHDADAVSRAVTAPGGAAIPAIRAAFPDCFDAAGLLDRKKLGVTIFADKAAKAKLEAIIHPHVWAAEKRALRLACKRGQRLVVFDIPLLFETGAVQRVDAVLVVSAPHFVQRARARKRGIDDAQFARILATQVPDGDKRRMADFVIPTGAGKHVTFRAIKRLVAQLS